MTALNFSTYQEDLFSFIKQGHGSCIIDAKAGAGKTTTIVEACNRLPETSSILFVAFNRAIVDELKLRLPPGVSCKTFNSIGWSSWLSYTGRKVQLEAKKSWNILRDNLSREDATMYGSFINKMVALAKSNGLSPQSSKNEWIALQDHHGLMLDCEDASLDTAIDYSVKTLEESIRLATRVCDFDDQIYMPWLKKSCFPRFDVVFIDEAQDTNSIQCDLLKRMLKPGGRLIAVGDPNQAIYGFRGADHEAMNNIRNTFDADVLPLSISYRCARRIIEEARQYVNDIEAFSGAPDGEVTSMDKYGIEDFQPSDAILCRNNAPLIEIAYQIISRGRGVNFMGKDLGAGLKSLIARMDADSTSDLSVKLATWLNKETQKLIQKGEEDKIETLQDKVKCINIFIDNLPAAKSRIADLNAAIDYLFEGNGRGITLASVHKSKGREWDRVFILDFAEYMPNKFAKKSWQKLQEKNLIYVAITRAKRSLVYLQSNGWKDSANINIPEIPSVPSVPASSNTSGKVERKGKLFNPFALK